MWLTAKERYIRCLESQVARLEEENRALLNSVMEKNGMRPLAVDTRMPKKETNPQKPARLGWRRLKSIAESARSVTKNRVGELKGAANG